jgi:hypothetical protein
MPLQPGSPSSPGYTRSNGAPHTPFLAVSAPMPPAPITHANSHSLASLSRRISPVSPICPRAAPDPGNYSLAPRSQTGSRPRYRQHRPAILAALPQAPPTKRASSVSPSRSTAIVTSSAASRLSISASSSSVQAASSRSSPLSASTAFSRFPAVARSFFVIVVIP